MTQVCDRENDGPEAAAPAVGQSRLLVLASSMLARATTRMIFGCSLRTRQGARPDCSVSGSWSRFRCRGVIAEDILARVR